MTTLVIAAVFVVLVCTLGWIADSRRFDRWVERVLEETE